MTFNEAKRIIKAHLENDKDFVMTVLDMVGESPKEEKKAEKREWKAPNKPKICEMCGKEFIPNSGVQKFCEHCKKLKQDITKTARELMEG